MALYSFASNVLGAGFFFSIIVATVIMLRLFFEKPHPVDDTGGPPTFKSKMLLLPGSIALLAGLLTVSSAILLHAFVTHDFLVKYVFQYSDRTLPLFYRVTAFWAGQAGSLLFWAWSVAIGGAVFALLPSYTRLTARTRLWYCLFYFIIMAFFLLLLSLWSNPFDLLNSRPADGQGLNPLLQNPGMIFHPPLLFLGYGGFVVPGCLALAQTLSGRLHDPVGKKRDEEHWGQASRAFILGAWALLTAGIILGAWWAYMELGWGGYWAWDPVENASLIPWLVASAYLHTAVIDSRRGKLQRTNVFLMALTTISAFFATYLVRSGVVESLHAFGDGGVGTPLLIFTLAFLYMALFISISEPGDNAKHLPFFIRAMLGSVIIILLGVLIWYQYTGHDAPVAWLGASMALLFIAILFLAKSPNHGAVELEDVTSKEGLLLIVAWLLLALSFIILVATMWPVIIKSLAEIFSLVATTWPGIFKFLTKIFGSLPAFMTESLSQKPMGLEPAFYNRVCLPLFAMFAVLLVFCPWRKWKLTPHSPGFTHTRLFLTVIAAVALVGAALWFYGITHPVSLLASACGLAAIYGIGLFFMKNKGFFSVRSSLAAHGVHLGLLMMIVGVAFSGPYQIKHTVEMGRQQSVKIDQIQVMLNELYEGEGQIGLDGRPNFRFIEAEIMVADQNGKPVGKLAPQRRMYTNFEQQTYAEVATLFSLGNEIYATLLSVDEQGRATLQININPLVNWLWIGGTLMCLFPFLGLARTRRLQEDDAQCMMRC